jgi:predicted oxidoreductase
MKTIYVDGIALITVPEHVLDSKMIADLLSTLANNGKVIEVI